MRPRDYLGLELNRYESQDTQKRTNQKHRSIAKGLRPFSRRQAGKKKTQIARVRKQRSCCPGFIGQERLHVADSLVRDQPDT